METDRMIGLPEGVMGATEGGPCPTGVSLTTSAAELAGESAVRRRDPAVPIAAQRWSERDEDRISEATQNGRGKGRFAPEQPRMMLLRLLSSRPPLAKVP